MRLEPEHGPSQGRRRRARGERAVRRRQAATRRRRDASAKRSERPVAPPVKIVLGLGVGAVRIRDRRPAARSPRAARRAPASGRASARRAVERLDRQCRRACASEARPRSRSVQRLRDQLAASPRCRAPRRPPVGEKHRPCGAFVWSARPKRQGGSAGACRASPNQCSMPGASFFAVSIQRATRFSLGRPGRAACALLILRHARDEVRGRCGGRDP